MLQPPSSLPYETFEDLYEVVYDLFSEEIGITIGLWNLVMS